MPPPRPRVPKIADPVKVKMTPAHIKALNDKLIDKGPTIALTSLMKTHEIQWTHGKFLGEGGSTMEKMYLHAVDRKTGVPLNPPKEDSSWAPKIVLWLPPCQVKWCTVDPKRMIQTLKDGKTPDWTKAPQETVMVMQPDDDRYDADLMEQFNTDVAALETIINEDRCRYHGDHEKELRFFPNRFKSDQVKRDGAKLTAQLLNALDDKDNNLATAKRPRTKGSTNTTVSRDFQRNRKNDPSTALSVGCAKTFDQFRSFYATGGGGEDAAANLDTIRKMQEQISDSLKPQIDEDTGQQKKMDRKKLTPLIHYDADGNVLQRDQVLRYLNTRGAIASLEIEIGAMRLTWPTENTKGDGRVSLPLYLRAIRWYVNGPKWVSSKVVAIESSDVFGADAFVDADEAEAAAASAPPPDKPDGENKRKAGDGDGDGDDDDDDGVFANMDLDAAEAEANKAETNGDTEAAAAGPAPDEPSPKKAGKGGKRAKRARTVRSAAVVSEEDLRGEDDGFAVAD